MEEDCSSESDERILDAEQPCSSRI